MSDNLREQERQAIAELDQLRHEAREAYQRARLINDAADIAAAEAELAYLEVVAEESSAAWDRRIAEAEGVADGFELEENDETEGEEPWQE